MQLHLLNLLTGTVILGALLWLLRSAGRCMLSGVRTSIWPRGEDEEHRTAIRRSSILWAISNAVLVVSVSYLFVSLFIDLVYPQFG